MYQTYPQAPPERVPYQRPDEEIVAYVVMYKTKKPTVLGRKNKIKLIPTKLQLTFAKFRRGLGWALGSGRGA